MPLLQLEKLHIEVREGRARGLAYLGFGTTSEPVLAVVCDCPRLGTHDRMKLGFIKFTTTPNEMLQGADRENGEKKLLWLLNFLRSDGFQLIDDHGGWWYEKRLWRPYLHPQELLEDPELLATAEEFGYQEGNQYALASVAFVHMKKQEYRAAVRAIQEAFKYRPEITLALNVRAELNLAAGRLQEAANDVDKALKNNEYNEYALSLKEEIAASRRG